MTWSLYESNETAGKEAKFLSPLTFSNGKTQEDVVKEVIKAISEGHKVIFIKGVCGTGKSAIALNLAKELGRASIVVPVKSLQKQYEDDYTTKKYLFKDNGQKLKISIITGRANFECPFLRENNTQLNPPTEQDSKLSEFYRVVAEKLEENKKQAKNQVNTDDNSCNNHFLPCKIEIKEKNIHQIREYLRKNPRVAFSDFGAVNHVRRMSIAPVCPYWSPIVPSEVDLSILDDAFIKSYRGLKNINYTFYQRKSGCGYYDQFNAYIDSDVIIFNSQKYKLETVMNRKPATDVEIIDECDEFLDSFSNHKKINFNRLNFALGNLYSEGDKTGEIIDKLIDLTKNILQDKKIEEHILNQEIIHIKDTKTLDLLRYFLDSAIMESVECDEENYCYYIDEVARTFDGFFNETYMSFYKEDKDVVARLVTTNLEKRFKELLDKNKIIVMMSGTIHSEKVLREIFGLSDFKIIEAETKTPGEITKSKTGFEFNCKYDNFQKGRVTREQYLFSLSRCIEQAKKPVLVHVNAFKDLPTEEEVKKYNLNIMSLEELKHIQTKDSIGEQVKRFKEGKIDILYSTRCNRGLDFPGSTCNSIVLTKYPYPDVNSLFWRILKKTRPEHYNDFYVDKARREFLQRIYRGLRSKNDHIFLLSPDSRVFSKSDKI